MASALPMMALKKAISKISLSNKKPICMTMDDQLCILLSILCYDDFVCNILYKGHEYDIIILVRL